MQEINNKNRMAAIIMLLAIFFYMLCHSSSCIKKTGNANADSFIEGLLENYPDDNIFEEAIENKIEDWTGFDLDLSPRSPEK